MARDYRTLRRRVWECGERECREALLGFATMRARGEVYGMEPGQATTLVDFITTYKAGEMLWDAAVQTARTGHYAIPEPEPTLGGSDLGDHVAGLLEGS